jgi:hypothetical protein
VDDIIDDSLRKLDEIVLTKYGPDIEAASDEEDEILPRVGHGEAFEALYKPRFLKKQREAGLQTPLGSLTLGEINIRRRQMDEHSQTDIRTYLVYKILYRVVWRCMRK